MYNILFHDNTTDDVRKDDVAKISIFMDEAYDLQNSKIVYNVTEHIWTIVQFVDNNIINAKINNYMFYKPLGDESLNYGNIISFSKNQIKEIKRYTIESYFNTSVMFLKFINSLPLEQKQILYTLNHQDKMQYIEQLINLKNPEYLKFKRN